MQLFAPADVGGFGGGPRAKEGAFFSCDALYWTLSQLEVRTIGTASPYNWEDTGFITSPFKWGIRLEGGAVYGHQGLLFSYYGLFGYTAKTRRTSGTTIVFGEDFLAFQPDYPDDWNLLFAEDFQAHNTVETWGVELNYLRRSHPLQRGGLIELFGGPRYLEFNEKFTVIANREAPVDDDETLSLDRHWLTEAENHIVGPQLGLRWFRQWGRWQASVEGRYLAGFNVQNFHQVGQIAVLDGGVEAKGSFNFTKFDRAYSNVVELRVEFKYQLTKAIFFKVGWTGLWMDHIARASNNVSYDDPYNGVAIRHPAHLEDVLLQGCNFGFIVNR